MMGSRPDITDILAIAWHRMRIGYERRSRGSQHRLLPPMRLGMPVGKGENSGFAVMESARSGEIILRVNHGDFKGSVANAKRLHIDKHKQVRRPANLRIAFVKCHWWDGSILLGATVEIIVHRIAAQFRNATVSHGIKS